MILCDYELYELVDRGLIVAPEGVLPSRALINSASVDIRIGWNIEVETAGGFEKRVLPKLGSAFDPGTCIRVETLESFHVPNGFAMDLRLKSSSARVFWNHMLAFWVDPGWNGVLTMEIKNERKFAPLVLIPEERFAQVLVHKTSGLSAHPYAGRYQNATSVEGPR